MWRFTAARNDLQRFNARRRDKSFKLLQIFQLFVLGEPDVYQYGLLTGIITVKQAITSLK
jgi:hypothetical protein